jgi:redox-sensing transcriptional repressor
MSNKPLETVTDVPEVVVLRLPQYVRALAELLRDEVQVVSSEQLGAHLRMTAAQIRKDLGYFGRFGKQGRGYPVGYLLGELRQVLGLERRWNACLIGVGRLGRAIVSYPGFNPEGFSIIAAFEHDPNQVGHTIGELVIQPFSEVEETLKERNIRIGIVAVPANQAQGVIDQLVKCGVRAVLNYAPITPQVPPGIRVRNIDPILALQSMTYYLKMA